MSYGTYFCDSRRWRAPAKLHHFDVESRQSPDTNMDDIAFFNSNMSD